jgi:DNA replication protein DnaC
VAQEWRRDRPARGFVLSGRVGSGKTHLLSATLRHLVLERGASAQYREISLLFADIRRGFNAGKSGGRSSPGWWTPTCWPSTSSAAGAAALRDGDARRADRPPLQLGAHHHRRHQLLARAGACAVPGPRGFHAPAQALEEREELLVERIGERIYSRLCEMCDFVSLPARTDDFRRTKQDGRPSRRLVRPAS